MATKLEEGEGALVAGPLKKSKKTLRYEDEFEVDSSQLIELS